MIRIVLWTIIFMGVAAAITWGIFVLGREYERRKKMQKKEERRVIDDRWDPPPFP